MRLLFPLFLAAALGTCLVTSLTAQELEVKQPQPAVLGVINDVDVTVTDLTEEKINNSPKREVKLERLAESLKLKLPKADPKLFEQKFAATFRLVISPQTRNFASFVYEGDGDAQHLAFIGQGRLLYPQDSGGSDLPSSTFQRMIKALPKDVSPAKEERELFTNPENFGALINVVAGEYDRAENTYWHFSFLGTTPEQVELRSKAVLTILDQGASRPIQLAILKRREPLCVQLRDQRKAVESAQRMSNVLQDELKSLADFTPDMLPNLRVQQMQLDVDLAGVQARIAACERLLEKTPQKVERRNQIEDLKVAAEIESSGFEARRAKSEEFIVKVKAKVELGTKLAKAEQSRKVALGGVRNSEEQIKRVDAAIHAYAPLPLVDNKITVQPLEWTQ
ncbi:MAG: hypothetical protein IAF94_15790 [Pirellulaceae bacterium]|nr:hypothetical protein [Pirellulaceae bacterium]